MDCLTKTERCFYDDLSLPSIQYVCEYINCTIYRDGTTHELRFKKGIPTSVISSGCDPQKQGMHIAFMIDSEVFHEHILPPDFILHVARTAATQMSGLTISVKIEEKGDWCATSSYYFPCSS